MMQDLLAFCADRAPLLRSRAEALARLESPSYNREAVNRCGAELAGMLRDIGGEVTLLPQRERGDHLRARFPGERGQVLLLGHFDTVWDVGQIERMPLREADGKLHGPGIFDMKAGIAIATVAVEALRHIVPPARRPEVVMLWTTDEEVGSGTSRSIIEAAARESDAVLVLEPSLPGGAVKTQRKGCGEFVLTVQGIPAHAGVDPRKGASAILELAHQIVALERLNDLDAGVTVNAGTIEGGSRPNVIAEHARVVIDVRVGTETAAVSVARALDALVPRDPRVTIRVTGGIDRPPMERSAGVARLYERARALAEELGRDLREGATGGGSDGNFTAALGVPTLDGLGPEGDGAHALHEHVVLEDLPWRAALVAGLIRDAVETVK